MQERYGNMTHSEEWYRKIADNENSILKESYAFSVLYEPIIMEAMLSPLRQDTLQEL